MPSVMARSAEIEGKHHRIFMPQSDAERADYREFWARLNRGEYQTGEFKRMRKDGRPVWIQASYNPVLDGRGKATQVIKFATDITARKIKALEDAGKMAAIDRAQAVIEFELDGTIITANENFLDAMGYALTEIRASITACSSSPRCGTVPAMRCLGQAQARRIRRPANTSGSERMAARSGSWPPTIPSSTRPDALQGRQIRLRRHREEAAGGGQRGQIDAIRSRKP